MSIGPAWIAIAALLAAGGVLLFIGARSPDRARSFAEAGAGERALRVLALVVWGAGLGGAVVKAVERPVQTTNLPPIRWSHVRFATQVEARIDKVLAVAKENDRPVMINFEADWCPGCVALERTTFVDDAVKLDSRRFAAIRVDVTEPTPQNEALQARFGVRGLPALVFVDKQGRLLDSPRLVGFATAPQLLAMMKQVR